MQQVDARTPVVVTSSVDRVLRDAAAAGVLLDVPGAVVARYDLFVDAGFGSGGHSGRLHRTLHDQAGVIEDVVVPLDHACLTCALREDIVPTLERLAEARPAAVVLSLPVASEPMPVLLALGDSPSLRRAAVVSVLDGDTLEHDLLGDDLLDERGLALTPADRRSVGEVLAHQVECADLALTRTPVAGRTATLLAHLTVPGAGQAALHDVDAARLLRPERRTPLEGRGDPRSVATPEVPDQHGVWTVRLSSWRPLHPQRLLDNLAILAAGPLRGRGCFWLPSRPDLVGAWDGAGGQLSIGGTGSWHGLPGDPAGAQDRHTTLVVTGLAGEGPAELRAAFESSLVTERELSRGRAWWQARADGFDAWLGDQRDAA